VINGTHHPYGFGGKEEQDELGLGWIDITARNYDPALGRWFVVDRLADDENQIDKSPYAYSWNSPISLNDPDGDCPWCIGALVGALTDVVIQVAEIALDDTKTASDFSFTSVGLSAAAGAVGVGIGSGLAKLAKVGKLAVVASKSKTAAKAIETTANVAGDALGSVAGSVIQGNEITVEGVAADIVGGRAGRGIAKNVKQTAQASPKAKVLKKQASTAKRKAGNNPRPNRAAKAAKAAKSATAPWAK
jgi:RHS repeat-associated protein